MSIELERNMLEKKSPIMSCLETLGFGILIGLR